MFANALKKVSGFTYPVIISKRYRSGQVECNCATFMVVNPDGWILTAAHVLNDMHLTQQQVKRLKHEKKLSGIRITNLSYWWGADGTIAKDFVVDETADLALGRLEPFNERAVSIYPVFKNPAGELPVGTSLCRLGFSFHRINATFDKATNTFQIAPGVLPLSHFPLDGIHTRVIVTTDEQAKRLVKFLETSSPGLRGQSGGPIFDRHGYIWGLQSHTNHFALGFSPKLKQGTKEIEEHQFLSVGLGSHVEEIVRFLKENKIFFNLSG